MINNLDFKKIFFLSFFLSFIFYTIYLISIVKFIFLPILIFIIGFLINLFFKKQGIWFLFFILPFINSVPAFSNIGYPHNYLSLSLFMFSGAIFYYFTFEKDFDKEKYKTENWEKYYFVFLIILYISSFFLFLRWSNITLSIRAFLKDTPITPSGERLSFGGIFPLLTLFQFSTLPVLYIIYNIKKLDKTKLLKFISFGFFISLIITFIQKFINDEFMVMRYGFHSISKKLKNGGFCDQNSFVFFAGIILLISVVYYYKNRKLSISMGIMGIIGGLLSGAKIFYIFITFALILFFYILKTDRKRNIIIFTVLILAFSIFIIVGGNTGSLRVKKSFNYLKSFVTTKNHRDRFYFINHASNGRAEMIINSLKILKKYPVEGVGAGNFLFYNEYQNLDKEHIHDLSLNEYLRILTETGIIGFIFFILFIITFSRQVKKEKLLLYIFALSILFFNNYLWFPEIIVLFSILLYLLKDKNEQNNKKTGKRFIIIAITSILVFSTSNIIDFNSLHPLRWAIEKGRDYGYGFWYKERDNRGIYKWTKRQSGIFISNPKRFKAKLFCGAPLDKFTEKKQTVEIFTNGKNIKKLVFKANEIKEFFIRKRKPFFLEFNVSPIFNLYKMKLGEERRDLGIIFYYNFYEQNIKKTSMETNLKFLNLFQGEKINIRFKIKNLSKEIISSETGYFISYHLKDKNGKKIKFDNRRFPINKKIGIGKEVFINIPIYFDYPIEGNYSVNFDIVKEGFYWGSSLGWKIPKLNLHLKKLFSQNFKEKYLKSFVKLNNNQIINHEQYILRLILKNNEVKADNKTIGFSPGSDYPQFWIRDIATFIKYAKLFYPLSMFKKQIEKFLILENKEGTIPDWFDLSGKSDKNSVESDQESSLVIAAYEIFLSEPEWINKKIKGEKIIVLLERTLSYLWNKRRLSNYNLIYGGLTADWGDVGNIYPDQRATKFNKKSIPVFSIYTQAKYIQAIKRLLIMLDFSGDKNSMIKWQNRLALIKQDTLKYLFDKNRGYFKIHYYPGENNYYQIENKIFATGGNVEAILSGILDKQKSKKVLFYLLRLKDKYKLRTVSFTLIPPYPTGFFKHPLLTKQWSYQNGGEWDWIGLRVIKAMFKYGMRDMGDLQFKKIIKKHLGNFNIFEWEDKNGVGRGASFYTGAAGIAGEIIFRYYGGFKENLKNYIIYTTDNLKELKIYTNKDEIILNNNKTGCKCKSKKLILKN